jgi:predicted metalloprotease with PDZ domain
MGGIVDGGWRLAWTDTLGPMSKANEEGDKAVDETHSIGLTLDRESGSVKDVVPGSAADRAGVSPEMKLLGVNGRHWNKDVLRDALAASRQAGSVELLLENQEFFRDAKLTYRDGRRYPALARNAATHDWVSEILAPHAR